MFKNHTGQREPKAEHFYSPQKTKAFVKDPSAHTWTK
jgi:hypothetical protein